MVRKRRPSKSARDVARVVVMRATQERYAGIAPAGLCAELSQVLIDAKTTRRWELNLMRQPWVRGWMDLTEHLMMPGISAHLLGRKRFVEGEVNAALDAGARQLIVLGAGYDLVAARALRRDPAPSAIEVDHPPTQARKELAYARWEGPTPTLLPMDLTQTDLRATLLSSPTFEVGAPTVCVAEGLVMYLAKDDVRDLLRIFVELTGPGSRLILSYCDADERGRARLSRFPGVMRAVARIAGEPLRWGIRAEDLPDFVAPLGLRIHRQPTREALEQELFAGRDHRLLRLGIEPFVVLESTDG